MASSSEGIKPAMKGYSFIDWEGLSEDEYQQLNKIINSPSASSAVKLPFCIDKGKDVETDLQDHPSCSQPKKQQPLQSPVEVECRRGRDETVFQANLPPPSHQPHLPSAVPPVVAYPVPVHHWAQNAPPPPPPGASHFPMSMQAGYVFPNQPPPPLVSNGDAATIAFVAAMSSGQPVYAIPGVPLQSIHNHYPGSGSYHQIEPMDLSVPVPPQQPVTVHHFVQPDRIVFTPSHHPHQAPVPVAQLPPNPGTNTCGHTATQASHNLPNVPPYNPHQHLDNVSHASHSGSHIVLSPPEIDPASLSQQEPKAKTEQRSEVDQPSVNKSPESSTAQSNCKDTISKSPPVSSSSSGVEFVGPIVFGMDNNISSQEKLANDESASVKTDLAMLNISDNAESNSSNVPGSTVDAKSTQAGSSHPEGAKSGVPVTNPPVPSSISSQPPADTSSPTETTHAEEKQLSVTPTSAQTAPQPQAPRMWSSLFGKSKTTNPVSPTSSSEGHVLGPVPLNPATPEEVKSVRYWQEKEQVEAKLNLTSTEKVIPVGIQNDPIAPKILDMLSSLPVVHTPIVIQPRGLVNGSNVCFMNAPYMRKASNEFSKLNLYSFAAVGPETLQVLMGCPPFIHLFRAFKNLPPRTGSGSCTPIFDSLNQFVNSFHNGQRVKSQGSRNKKGAHMDINVGQPFSPTSLLSVAQDILGLRIGIQHDAEEFLSKILMICHEELENVMKLNQVPALNNNNGKMATNNGHVGESAVDGDIDEDDESWQKVGPKNHHVETNVNDCGQTPLSSIFSGLSRSCLTRETGKNSDTLDSFFTLKLDIQGENVHSVSDALQRLNVSETLLDIDGGKIQGQRRVFFDVLPPVLIMHLKLFQYSDGNGRKIQKKIDFDVDLTIPRETLSRVGKNKYTSAKSRSYKLFGVVNHHGLKMTDGHYTSDVFLPVASGWLRFDDSEVFAIHEKQVLQHSDRHMPYLLFYRRMDVS